MGFGCPACKARLFGFLSVAEDCTFLLFKMPRINSVIDSKREPLRRLAMILNNNNFYLYLKL